MSNWGESIAHFHIKGTVHAGQRTVDDPPAGMDDINWGSVFAVLYGRGYDGDLSIEPHSNTWHGDLADFGVAFTRDYVKKFICK
jgi:sugar phosphate isomerase/epimerase